MVNIIPVPQTKNHTYSANLNLGNFCRFCCMFKAPYGIFVNKYLSNWVNLVGLSALRVFAFRRLVIPMLQPAKPDPENYRACNSRMYMGVYFSS